MAGDELRPVERQALEALDLGGLVALLRELIAIPSLDGQETPAQRRVAEWLDAEGFEVDAWPIDLEALARHPDWCHEVERDEALGVVGWIGERAAVREARPGQTPGDVGRDLVFNGHIDVVPPGDESAWTTPPWDPAVRDGRVYGRGAVDMKGGLCCALFAAKAVRDAGVRLRGRLSVASVVGEEDGGTGTLATLLRGHTADGAVVVEPTRLHVVPAQAGSLMFRLVVHGLSAHGCVREEGVSAVEKFVPLLTALRRLEAERCGVPAGGRAGTDAGRRRPRGGRRRPALTALRRLSPALADRSGHRAGGRLGLQRPRHAVAEGRYGVAVGEDVADAESRSARMRRGPVTFEQAIARAAADDPWLSAHPPEVEWWGGRFDPAVTDPHDAIVTAVSAATAAVTGSVPVVEGVTYGADMRLLVNVGRIPTVLFGPGDVRVAHMPDEHVPLAELEAAARVLVVAAIRFCGVA